MAYKLHHWWHIDISLISILNLSENSLSVIIEVHTEIISEYTLNATFNDEIYLPNTWSLVLIFRKFTYARGSKILRGLLNAVVYFVYAI